MRVKEKPNIYENMPEYPVLRTGMNGILSVPLPRWEGLGEGENGKGFSPPPLSSPIKGEEIVFKEIGRPRPVGGVIHLLKSYIYLSRSGSVELTKENSLPCTQS